LQSLYDHLESVAQPSEKRQLEESKKGIDALFKKLARGQIDDEVNAKLLAIVAQIGNYDFRAATATQTSLVNTDWKIHKDWLKGLKVLLQLAVKRLY
jgi:protein transport protein SEC31